MKRILYLVALGLVLTGCGGTDTTQVSDNAMQDSVVLAEEPQPMGWSEDWLPDDFIQKEEVVVVKEEYVMGTYISKLKGITGTNKTFMMGYKDNKEAGKIDLYMEGIADVDTVLRAMTTYANAYGVIATFNIIDENGEISDVLDGVVEGYAYGSDKYQMNEFVADKRVNKFDQEFSDMVKQDELAQAKAVLSDKDFESWLTVSNVSRGIKAMGNTDASYLYIVTDTFDEEDISAKEFDVDSELAKNINSYCRELIKKETSVKSVWLKNSKLEVSKFELDGEYKEGTYNWFLASNINSANRAVAEAKGELEVVVNYTEDNFISDLKKKTDTLEVFYVNMQDVTYVGLRVPVKNKALTDIEDFTDKYSLKYEKDGKTETASLGSYVTQLKDQIINGGIEVTCIYVADVDGTVTKIDLEGKYTEGTFGYAIIEMMNEANTELNASDDTENTNN